MNHSGNKRASVLPTVLTTARLLESVSLRSHPTKLPSRGPPGLADNHPPRHEHLYLGAASTTAADAADLS